MHYLKHYIRLMRRAEQRQKPEGYTESHHIFPRAVFGDNNRVVTLTSREHFVAHLLLWKGLRQREGNTERTLRMGRAVYLMSNLCPGGKTSWHYEDARKQHIILLSRPRPQKTKDAISKALTGRSFSDTHRKALSEAKKGKPQPHLNRKGKSAPASTRAKLSKAAKGKKWWNDGEKDKMSFECPGAGWKRGRLYTQQLNKKRWAK